MISDEKLDDLQVLCDAATNGPWMTTPDRPYGIGVETAPHTFPMSLLMLDVDGMACVDRDEDARFIVEARTALPELLAEVRRLRDAEREHASEVANLQHAHAHHDREQSDEIKRLHQVIDALRPLRDRVEGECNVLYAAMERIAAQEHPRRDGGPAAWKIAKEALAEVAKMQITPVADLRAAADRVIDGPRPPVAQIKALQKVLGEHTRSDPSDYWRGVWAALEWARGGEAQPDLARMLIHVKETL